MAISVPFDISDGYGLIESNDTLLLFGDDGVVVISRIFEYILTNIRRTIEGNFVGNRPVLRHNSYSHNISPFNYWNVGHISIHDPAKMLDIIILDIIM